MVACDDAEIIHMNICFGVCRRSQAVIPKRHGWQDNRQKKLKKSLTLELRGGRLKKWKKRRTVMPAKEVPRKFKA